MSLVGHALRLPCMRQVTRAVIEAAKGRLKVVGRAGVGVDNVDLTAATEVRSGRLPMCVLSSPHGVLLSRTWACC